MTTRRQLIDHEDQSLALPDLPATLTITIHVDQPRQPIYEVYLNKPGCPDREADRLAAAVLESVHRDLPRYITALRQDATP